MSTKNNSYTRTIAQLTVRAAWDDIVQVITEATKIEPYLGSC